MVKYNVIFVNLVELVDIVGLFKYLFEIIVFGRELERNTGAVFDRDNRYW